jgi:ubiquinone/menaquinone biosynthesis C-methylase UbiE
MRNKQTVLSSSEAQAYYDQFGKKQDSQGFYEDLAIDDLIAHATFQDAEAVFEFGCGTGKFATLLLEEHLRPSATYFGCDVSPVMVELATQRIIPYAERAKVVRSDGAIHFQLTDHSVDRVICNYVLDLLSERDTRLVFAEAHRVLTLSGKLCLVSLTKGVTLLSRIVSSFWEAVFRMRASLVGGCRPIRLESYVDQGYWQIEYQKVMTAFSVPSEVLVLSPEIVPNRVAGGFYPPAPTPPGMRVRTGRFTKIPGRSREYDLDSSLKS